MSDRDDDPWARWYDGYVRHRAAIRTARQASSERRKAANVVAGLLVAYMVFGGIMASLAVTLVMAN